MAVAHSKLADINSMAHITSVTARSKDDDVLFRELSEVLRRHDAEDRFGITLLHKHFEIGPDEMLMEYTNEEERRQTIVVEKVAKVDFAQTIETAWRLKDGEVQMACNCVKQDDHNHRQT